MRPALARLPDGEHRFVDHLDDGSPIAVTITVAGDAATIDFTGTGPVLPGNLNANRAIVTAAVMYCLRCLIDEDIPLNQGVLAPVQIVLPECLLNPPEGTTPAECPAVVGGNVETSQRVVDVLLGALGIAAASQGTMNNLLFGDAHVRLLRNDLRRRRRHGRRRRRRRRAHAHDQHAADRSRSPRTPLPGPRAGVLHPPRFRRRGAASGRRRHRPPPGVPRGLGSLDPFAAARRPIRRSAWPAASRAP